MGRGIYIWGKYEINVYKFRNMDLKICQIIFFLKISLAGMVKDLGGGVGSLFLRGYYKVQYVNDCWDVYVDLMVCDNNFNLFLVG